MGKPIVPYIAMPLHSMFGVHYMAIRALWCSATARYPKAIGSPSLNSVLPMNFNEQLCSAYNMRESHGVTHFAMLHGDIEPQDTWLDVLFDEYFASKADIISAVVPLKPLNDRHAGVTSTAIGRELPNGRLDHIKLSLSDVYKLPETFGIEDTPWPDRMLLLNTGCMLFSVDAPWVLDFFKSGGFNFETWIDEHEGVMTSCGISEDWRFSHWAYRQGLRCVATRKVQLNHWGISPFGNSRAWGNPANDAITEEAETVA